MRRWFQTVQYPIHAAFPSPTSSETLNERWSPTCLLGCCGLLRPHFTRAGCACWCSRPKISCPAAVPIQPRDPSVAQQCAPSADTHHEAYVWLCMGTAVRAGPGWRKEGVRSFTDGRSVAQNLACKPQSCTNPSGAVVVLLGAPRKQRSLLWGQGRSWAQHRGSWERLMAALSAKRTLLCCMHWHSIHTGGRFSPLLGLMAPAERCCALQHRLPRGGRRSSWQKRPFSTQFASRTQEDGHPPRRPPLTGQQAAIMPALWSRPPGRGRSTPGSGRGLAVGVSMQLAPLLRPEAAKRSAASAPWWRSPSAPPSPRRASPRRRRARLWWPTRCSGEPGSGGGRGVRGRRRWGRRWRPRPPPSSRGGGLRAGRAARLRCTAVVPLGRPRQLPHGWPGARAGL